MAKIKISVPVKLKKDMDKYKYVDWSAVVTTAFRKKLEELHKSKSKTLKKDEAALVKKLDFTKEGILTALASEKVLAKDWLSKKEDEAWKRLKKKK